MYLFRSLQNLSVNLEYVRPKISYLHPFLTYFTVFTKNRCKIYSFYSTKMNITRIKTEAFIGGSKGGRQGRAPPPGGPKFFHFHAVFGKKLKNNSTFGSWRPPLGKILDPPLAFYRLVHKDEARCNLYFRTD